MDSKQSLFRKEAIGHITSPEQLTDYLCVTNPGTWAILLVVIAILVSIIAWSTIGTLETTSDVKVVVKDHTAKVMPTSGAKITSGMEMHVSGEEPLIKDFSLKMKTGDRGSIQTESKQLSIKKKQIGS